MELLINDLNKQVILNFENNVIIFGQNSKNKTNLINNIINGFHGKNKNILINGKTIDYKDYNFIYINEETDFAEEFKFTKNNELKQIIYNDVINKVNSEKLIHYTNEIFDIIDDRINNLLNKKINKNSDNNLSLKIEIPDINSIIDKFTNIYIDDILLNNNEISKSMKRKLLYQLYFLLIKKENNKEQVIVIDNFDVYLNTNEIINILHNINELSNKNCHFILTSCNNIFEYIDLNKFSIYRCTERLISIDYIQEAIKNYLIRKEYCNNNFNIDYESFYNTNEFLINDDEIINIKEKLFSKYPHIISKILNCNSIKIVLSKPKNISSEYIICDSKEMQQLFLEIVNKLID